MAGKMARSLGLMRGDHWVENSVFVLGQQRADQKVEKTAQHLVGKKVPTMAAE